MIIRNNSFEVKTQKWFQNFAGKLRSRFSPDTTINFVTFNPFTRKKRDSYQSNESIRLLLSKPLTRFQQMNRRLNAAVERDKNKKTTTVIYILIVRVSMALMAPSWKIKLKINMKGPSISATTRCRFYRYMNTSSFVSIRGAFERRTRSAQR